MGVDASQTEEGHTSADRAALWVARYSGHMVPRQLQQLVSASILLVCLGPEAKAAEIQRTRYQLPVSNGHGAAIIDLEHARVDHFREHLFAAEEPVLDAEGEEVWDGSQFAAVYTRDLVFDTYFGLRIEGDQFWLPTRPVDYDASGYEGYNQATEGGTGVVVVHQQVGALEVRQHIFAPAEGLPHAALVMAIEVVNTSDQPISGVQAFSLHNYHLGYGRPQSPWDVSEDIGENGETLVVSGGDIEERGFAGVIVTRPLAPVAHTGFAPEAAVYDIVANGGGVNLPDNSPPPNAVDGSVSALQFDLGTLAPGAHGWAGFVFAHHADPFAAAEVQEWLDAYTNGQSAEALVEAERTGWANFQAELTPPEGLSPAEEQLVRHSAAMLRMGQVQEDAFYLRDKLANDNEPRRTRFLGPNDEPAQLPGMVSHHGRGAVLASLPPGNWTYAWIRDGAYATVGMAEVGMHQQARDALEFYLKAEAGRFAFWDELADYGLEPYQISLVRYYGFGVEETDFNDFGPNLEFDGFGLFLWALHAYEQITGDTTLVDAYWPDVAAKIGDALVGLIEPETGLIRPDSSIWETHWLGRQRHFTYTDLTAVRGLCDAAALAERVGDMERAQSYAAAADSLRTAMVERLTDDTHALAANLEERNAGGGYWDAAVLDAFAMGLFDPEGEITQATLDGLDANLGVAAGPGWSRNDDRWDHQGNTDLSPWGSDYDSAEWVITDLRGAIATRMRGDAERSDSLLTWVREQAEANFLMVAETFDENDGTYKFNTPMLGFGAGAYILALAHRAQPLADPACGAYFDEPDVDPGTTTGDPTETATETSGELDTDFTITGTTDPSTGDDSDGTTEGSSTGGVTVSGSATETRGVDDGEGCGCRAAPGEEGMGWAAWAFAWMGLSALRRRRRDTHG